MYPVHRGGQCSSYCLYPGHRGGLCENQGKSKGTGYRFILWSIFHRTFHLPGSLTRLTTGLTNSVHGFCQFLYNTRMFLGGLHQQSVTSQNKSVLFFKFMQAYYAGYTISTAWSLSMTVMRALLYLYPLMVFSEATLSVFSFCHNWDGISKCCENLMTILFFSVFIWKNVETSIPFIKTLCSFLCVGFRVHCITLMLCDSS